MRERVIHGRTVKIIEPGDDGYELGVEVQAVMEDRNYTFDAIKKLDRLTDEQVALILGALSDVWFSEIEPKKF